MTTASLSRRRAVNPPNVPAPIRGYYSNAVRVEPGPLLYIAGQVAIDLQGHLVGKGDAAAQCEQILKNIAGICESQGATLADVVKVTVYTTDIAILDRIAPVRLKYFPKDGPASVLVEVSKLVEPDMVLEIEAVVAVR
jgi:enamine deaminase RidA (YjgF/YER057c/UK114 family)